MKLLHIFSGLLLVQGIVASVAVRNDNDDCTDNHGKHCKVWQRCGGECRNDDWFKNSDQNCGKCGVSCQGGKKCQGKECKCPSEKPIWCNNKCVSARDEIFKSDRNNCGGCGNRCNDDEDCENWEKKPRCRDGKTKCGRDCVDLKTDEKNCGSCGYQCRGPKSECKDKQCVCPSNKKWCNNDCRSDDWFKKDRNNCGSCGNRCNDDEDCEDGHKKPRCHDGKTSCGNPKKCVDLKTDEKNCGSCGYECHGPKSECKDKQCVCPKDKKWCDNDCRSNDWFKKDRNNCGGCGNRCNDDEECEDGHKKPRCKDGKKWCDGKCVDFQKDEKNCGHCKNPCGEGEKCNKGVCAPKCELPKKQCPGSNKCVDLQKDEHNCGSCGTQCQGEKNECKAGVCVCPRNKPIWCNGHCHEEKEFKEDRNNCGGCGNQCKEDERCEGGKPRPRCDGGKKWCDNDCRSDDWFKKNRQHCGECNKRCGEDEDCDNGHPRKKDVCLPPKKQCWGGKDGCINVMDSDNNNCGDCRKKCEGKKNTCVKGVCSCPSGKVWCDDDCRSPEYFENNDKHCGNCETKCLEHFKCHQNMCIKEQEHDHNPEPGCKNPAPCPRKNKPRGLSLIARNNNQCGPDNKCFCHNDEKGNAHCHSKAKCKDLKKCEVSYSPVVVRRDPTIASVPVPIMCPADAPTCVENCCGKVCRKLSDEIGGKTKDPKGGKGNMPRGYLEMRDDGEEESD